MNEQWPHLSAVRQQIIDEAARKIGATPADIPGLWNAPGYLELTTGQLIAAADAATIGEHYAYNFDQGCVAPDGSIWLTPTSRATSGVVQITEAEAIKAKRFGWKETGNRSFGYTHVSRA